MATPALSTIISYRASSLDDRPQAGSRLVGSQPAAICTGRPAEDGYTVRVKKPLATRLWSAVST